MMSLGSTNVVRIAARQLAGIAFGLYLESGGEREAFLEWVADLTGLAGTPVELVRLYRRRVAHVRETFANLPPEARDRAMKETET